MKDYLKIGILEITWWKHRGFGFVIYPAIELCKTGNTRGLKVRFMRWTLDFSWYPKKLNAYKNDPKAPWNLRK